MFLLAKEKENVYTFKGLKKQRAFPKLSQNNEQERAGYKEMLKEKLFSVKIILTITVKNSRWKK